MARQITAYVNHLFRHDALAIVITSGSPPVVRFSTGDRAAAQPMDHAKVQALVQEAASPLAMADLRAGRPASFSIEEEGKTVQVDVLPRGAIWRVTIARPSATGPVRSSGPSTGSRGGGPRPISLELDDEPSSSSKQALGRIELQSVSVAAPASPRNHSSGPPPHAPIISAPRAPAGPDYGPPGIDRWLKMMTAKDASDLHLSTGMPPMIRLHGGMEKLEEGAPVLTHDNLKEILFGIMPEKNREEWEKRHDSDFAYEIKGLSRYRGNAFMDRRGIGAVFRKIPFEILSPEKLGIPPKVLELCNLTKGLVVVTGPTGSGKSTTLATLVDVINSTREDHIITIEDPIEFVHENKKCLVNQREVKVHTDSFKDALRAALREDPDIVLVGEMRDLETIAIAIETAETGHLVFGTLHTSTAPSTVDRIIDQFSADRQSQIRTMLSESLKGVIAQVLCKKIGGGRAAAYEILLGNAAVANLIREGKTFQIPSIMQTSRNIGMCTMNDSLMEHVKAGRVEPREAYLKSVNKSEMQTLLAQAGHKVVL